MRIRVTVFGVWDAAAAAEKVLYEFTSSKISAFYLVFMNVNPANGNGGKCNNAAGLMAGKFYTFFTAQQMAKSRTIFKLL